MRARVCVIHWHCTAQLSMFNMEKRYRNKIIIIIIIIIIIREPYLDVHGSVKKDFNVGFHSDIFRPISFKLGMMIETTKLNIFVSLDDRDLQSRSQLYKRKKNKKNPTTSVPILSRIRVSIWSIRFTFSCVRTRVNPFVSNLVRY